MKHFSRLLIFGLLFSVSHTDLMAYADDNFDDDIFAVDNDLDDINVSNGQSFNIPTARSLGNSDNIFLFLSLLQELNANYPQIVLNTPIYQQTSPVRNRPILEYPFTLTYGFDTKDTNQLSLTLFFNYWNPKNYTKTGTTLTTYFDLANPARIAVLEAFENEYTGQGTTVTSIAQSLGLFDPATIEERRLGGVLASHVIHNKWNLMLQLPILYTEQNLHLKPWEKAAIEASSIGKLLQNDNVTQDDFTYDHIVMDQFGFGDLKFKVMYQMHNTNTFNLDLGGFIILPTAAALKQGIVGVWFDQTNNRAYLDLTTIDQTNFTKQNKEDVVNFFLAAVDKLSSNILNTPLGNGGFVMLAPSMNFDWHFGYNWQLSNDVSAQIPLPTMQPRFYQYVQSATQFQEAYNAAFNAGPDQLADFVNQEIQNLFFPYEFPTRVFPGVVINSTTQFLYTFRDWDFSFGGNFWYQGAESLTPPIFANPSTYSYDYVGAAAASAMQEKVFAQILCNLETTNYAWSLSLYGDITVWNQGIGKDYTLAISVDCKF